jgi:hypothetical protein
MKTRVDFSRNEVASMMRREIGVGGEIRGEGGKDKRGVKQRREERKRRLGSLGGRRNGGNGMENEALTSFCLRPQNTVPDLPGCGCLEPQA